MALQTGPLYFEGTIGGMTFYRMEGKYYVRKKTSLTRERVMADKAFERSRQAARVFGEASKLASEVYRILPKEKRKHGLIGKLSGAANRLLHEGRNQAEVAVVLLKQYAGVEVQAVEEKSPEKPVAARPHYQRPEGRCIDGSEQECGFDPADFIRIRKLKTEPLRKSPVRSRDKALAVL